MFKKNLVAVCLISVVLFSSCVSEKKENFVLNGMIYNEKNEGVNGVKVFAGENEIAVSDLYGHFYIPYYPDDVEELCFRKKDYEVSYVPVEHSDQIQLVYVKLKSYERVFEECEKLMIEKKYNDAESRLEKLLCEASENPEILFLLAAAEFKNGKKIESSSHLKQIAVPDESVKSFLAMIEESGE